MNSSEETYIQMLSTVLKQGEFVESRTGEPCYSYLGYLSRYDTANAFPILTTKKVAWRKSIAEMLFFISGRCDRLDFLREMGAENIWKPWATPDGSLGRIYGMQWRDWAGSDGNRYDQLQKAVDEIRNNPTSRRIIVSGWRPDEMEGMALPPCHVLFHFTVRGETLHLELWQRSCDLPIGGPFNICQYAALLHMVAKITGKKPGTFIHSISDAHIYRNQVEGVEKQLENASRNDLKSPKLVLKDRGQKEIDDFVLDDFSLEGYEHQGVIKYPVAV